MYKYAHMKLFVAFITATTLGIQCGRLEITIPSYDNKISRSQSPTQSPTLSFDYTRRFERLEKELKNHAEIKSNKETSALILEIGSALNADQFCTGLSRLVKSKGIDIWRKEGSSWKNHERNAFIALYAQNQPKSKQILLSLILENPIETLIRLRNKNNPEKIYTPLDYENSKAIIDAFMNAQRAQ